MSKYQPLTDQLASLGAAGQQTAEFDFSALADLVGGLPPSAFKYQAWWANDSKVEAEAWRAADWHVDIVNLAQQRVRFARGAVGGSHRRTGNSQTAPSHLLAADLDRLGGSALDVRIRLTWQPVGAAILEPDGRVRFANTPHAAGIYRIILWGQRGEPRPEVYIGEAQDLRRRWYNYRNPGPSQQTSLRLNAKLIEHLQQGGQVALAVAASATIQAGDQVPAALSLARKTARVLAEHAAVALEYLRDEMTVLNLDKQVDGDDESV